MRVLVLTTSYPRGRGDIAGLFVADAVRHLRVAGVEVEVVSPASFPHFGLAYGAGIVGNVRRRPWLALLVPAFLVSFWLAARRGARGVDLVHAHWLGSALVGTLLRRPLVVQPWGTDVELAKRVPWLARWIFRRSAAVLCASNALADEARRFGAERVYVVPSGVAVPDEPGEEDEPPHVLYAGRLSAEKGVLELVEAARGLPLVVAGDGPLRDRVPGALGFVPHDELEALYEHAAVVACPSHREGFGVACAEAMAHGKPVVASAVGGLLDLVVDGETGLLVPPGEVAALREALERLLGNRELRRRLGEAGRARVRERFGWDAVTAATIRVYVDALGERA